MEILVAVVVIFVLAALVPVTFDGLREVCRRGKEATVIRSIVNAVKSFENDYGTPPLLTLPRNEKEKFIFVGDPRSGALQSNAALFDVLRAIPRGVNANHGLNPRRQKYFEESKATDPSNPRDGFCDGSEFPNTIQGRLLDKHGSEYCVVMDTSKEGVLDISGIYTDLTDPIRYGVIAFGLGKDRWLGTAGDRRFRIPKSNAPPGDVVSWQ
jgi:type II secretory pathway pseudopilin PulG